MNDWKTKVVWLREHAQLAADRSTLQASADACDAAVAELETLRVELARALGEVDLAQAQLRAEAMRMRDRLKGVPVAKMNGAA